MATGDLIRAAESGGDPNAKNPNSTASGPDQFLDRTWLETIKAARPDLAGQPDEALLGLKTNPEISGQVRDAYAAQNGAVLSRAGLPVTPGNTYLAHFAGPGGAVGLLNADPTTPASAILGPRVIAANPFLSGMTAGDVASWATRKMGGTAAAPQAQPQAPMSLAPQPPPAAPAPQQQQQQQSAPQYGGGAAPAPMPTEQAPAPFALLPPPKKIDLASVFANLKRG